MKEFSLLNFHTLYKAELRRDEKIFKEINCLDKGDYCFGSVFSANIDKDCTVDYEIHMYNNNSQLKKKKNNICLLKYHQIYNHIAVLKNLFPFMFKIRENGNKYIINIKLGGVANISHRFLLTWVRYLYEFPFNVCLQDVYRLRKIPECRFISSINLTNIVMQVEYDNINQHGVGIHSIIYNKYLYQLQSNKELKNTLENGNVNKVNYIFTKIGNGIYVNSNKHPKLNAHDLEFWSEENFEKYRKEKYLKALNRCKTGK